MSGNVKSSTTTAAQYLEVGRDPCLVAQERQMNGVLQRGDVFLHAARCRTRLACAVSAARLLGDSRRIVKL